VFKGGTKGTYTIYGIGGPNPFSRMWAKGRQLIRLWSYGLLPLQLTDDGRRLSRILV